jgi:hypothetical protein
VAEKRLLLTNYPDDWRHYTIVEPVFRMKNFTPREAYEGLLRSYEQVSSFGSSLKRSLRTFMKTRSLFSTGISFSWNYHAYRTIRNTPTPLATLDDGFDVDGAAASTAGAQVQPIFFENSRGSQPLRGLRP